MLSRKGKTHMKIPQLETLLKQHFIANFYIYIMKVMGEAGVFFGSYKKVFFNIKVMNFHCKYLLG